MGEGPRFRVLGPVEVLDDAGQPLAIGGPKPRTLLAAMLLDVGRPVSTDAIIDAVWGDAPPAQATGTVQVYVSKLRKTLGEDAIRTKHPGYVLDVDPGTVDHVEFERLRRDAAEALGAQRYGAAATGFRNALALWRGDPLSDLPTSRFAEGFVAAVTRARAAAERRLVEAEIGLGHHEAILGEVANLVAANPLDEALRGLAMIAHYRAGRTATALELFEEGRRHLADELGMDPSPELAELHRRILNHDPHLKVPPTSTEGPEAALDGSTTRRRSLSEALRGVVQYDDEVFDLDRPVVTLGRHSDRTIQVDDPEASRRHAEIRRVGDTYILRDEGSTNGTEVNGEPVIEHELHDGDEISIGSATLMFRLLPVLDP